MDQEKLIGELLAELKSLREIVEGDNDSNAPVDFVARLTSADAAISKAEVR